MFYLTTHSTHFIYGYMASGIWLRTIMIVRKETRCRHIGYSFRLAARVLLYAPSHIQDNTYHGLCYTSRGALAGTRNSSMGPPHEGSIRRPTAPWVNALPLSYVPLPRNNGCTGNCISLLLSSFFFCVQFLCAPWIQIVNSDSDCCLHELHSQQQVVSFAPKVFFHCFGLWPDVFPDTVICWTSL